MDQWPFLMGSVGSRAVNEALSWLLIVLAIAVFYRVAFWSRINVWWYKSEPENNTESRLWLVRWQSEPSVLLCFCKHLSSPVGLWHVCLTVYYLLEPVSLRNLNLCCVSVLFATFQPQAAVHPMDNNLSILHRVQYHWLYLANNKFVQFT